jgi:hypothetical protein
VIPQLEGWETFYVIVGSSAAALTGLMFVVITLIADSETTPRSSRTLAAFGTPTVVHFCVVLVVAAILTAPWRMLANVAGAIGMTGAAGLVYTLVIVRRARRQTAYTPVIEDWLFHSVFPFAAYAAVVIAAVVLRTYPERALFAIAAAVLALVLIGIHNAWDTVTYVAVSQPEKADRS